MGEEKMVPWKWIGGFFEEKSDGENEDILKCEWERL